MLSSHSARLLMGSVFFFGLVDSTTAHLLSTASSAAFSSSSFEPPPQGGAPCSTDWNCSLGGTCTNSHCICDPWFTGANCTLLNLAPAEPTNGMQIPSYHSWGGHAALDPNTGLYHGFFSFMCRHATLDDWTTKSSIVHAIAKAPEGPYLFEQMVLQPWSHNAYLTRDPPSGKWLLWHIGNARTDPIEWYPCYSPTKEVRGQPLDPLSSPFAAQHRRDTEHPFSPDFSPASSRLHRPLNDMDVLYVETADSLEGPWTSFNNNGGVDVKLDGSCFTGTSNPAPFIFDNGTTLLFFTGRACPANWSALASNCIGLARADSWHGPYTELATLPIVHPESEDPSVFRDRRGNFHLLTNVNTGHLRCAESVPCGGHAWSRDGITWSDLYIGAFGPIIHFKNGTTVVYAYTERAQVLQAGDGTPRVLFTGMGKSAYEDSITWSQNFCQAGQQGCGPSTPWKLRNE